MPRKASASSAARRAACPLFWTLDGNQAGKAAIAGWRDILQPALLDPLLAPRLSIWPFSGLLEDLLRPAESYPAEYYQRLGIDLRLGSSSGKWGKRWLDIRARTVRQG